MTKDKATLIAEAIMDAIEARKGILKDDLIDAARKVLAVDDGRKFIDWPQWYETPTPGRTTHSWRIDENTKEVIVNGRRYPIEALWDGTGLDLGG